MKFSTPIALRFALSLLVGSSFAFNFAFPYFSDEAYTLLDKISLFAVPASALTFIVYYLFSQVKWMQAPFFSHLLTFGLAFLAAVIGTVSMASSSLLQWVVNAILLTVIFSALILPSASFLEKKIEEKEHFRLLFGWLFAGIVSFFAVGFLCKFYSNLYQTALLVVFFEIIFGVFFYYTFGQIKHFMRKDAVSFWLVLLLFTLAIVFQVMIFRIGLQFPKLFNSNLFLLDAKEIIIFALASLISLPWLAWALHRLKEPDLHHFLVRSKLIAFIQENLYGLILSALFFGLYLLIGSVLNFPAFDVDDIFFDADGFIWRFRLTTDHWQDFYWRSVHPLALLILRPSVILLSWFLHGDKHFSAIVLTAIAGAACVFLMWMLMKKILQNNVSALIMAFLLGISTSHLIFASLTETYIFLAVATLLFFVLIQKENHSLPLLVSVGIMTMGITLTNFAQTVIALFGARPNLKSIFRYVVIVVTLVVSLTLLSNVFYPNASPYFFVPSSFLAERQNVRSVSLNRAQALARAFLFNNIVAPTPLLSHKDIPFTQFRFYRAEDGRISEYGTPLQSTAGWVWFALLAIAAIFFVKDFKSHNIRLTLSLIGCLAFNLLLHLRYGKELFLYSPNWTYAIVLLLGISWKNLLAHKWFQILLLAFLLLLTLNNAVLIRTIMEISVPYIN